MPDTPFGRFEYTHISKAAFSVGLTSIKKDGYAFVMATPEKALCDLIANSSKVNLRYLKDAEIYLEEDIRMEPGLYNGGFFDVAAFYGGTCLRIFHGLQRFSEDMDFSLLAPDDKFDFTKYFQPIIDEFAIVGREVEIKKKDKKSFGKVESAFLKDNTDVYDLSFQTDKSIKIKIEVDTQPPLNFRTEQKLLLQPHSFMTRCFTLPDLFAGKMHALVYRG